MVWDKFDRLIALIIVLIGIIVIYFGINRSSDQETTRVDRLLDSISKQAIIIKRQKHISDSLSTINTNLYKHIDSLTHLKQQTIKEYETIYTNIQVSTNIELDSIIRSNW